jgi:hypothetical protein
MTNNSTNTARIVNSTAPLLKKASQALPNVVLDICEQSATFPILDNRVIAINPTSTITAMLIIVLTSTIGYSEKYRLISDLFFDFGLTHKELNKPITKLNQCHTNKNRHERREYYIPISKSTLHSKQVYDRRSS